MEENLIPLVLFEAFLLLLQIGDIVEHKYPIILKENRLQNILQNIVTDHLGTKASEVWPEWGVGGKFFLQKSFKNFQSYYS